MDWRKYLLVFLITLGLFLSAFYLSNYVGGKKIAEIKDIQDKISIDILSSEVKFSLIEELSCEDVDNTYLSDELGDLAQKIEYSEENIGRSDDVTGLKKTYSLLQIKDYLLMKKIRERCGFKTIFVLYFYGKPNECSGCEKQGYVLTELRDKYPEFRVYSFDYNLDLSALRALISIYNIKKEELPALVINGKVYKGFQSIEDIEKNLPGLMKLDKIPENEKTTP